MGERGMEGEGAKSLRRREREGDAAACNELHGAARRSARRRLQPTGLGNSTKGGRKEVDAGQRAEGRASEEKGGTAQPPSLGRRTKKGQAGPGRSRHASGTTPALHMSCSAAQNTGVVRCGET